MLVALLLPAVQAAREAARKIQCANHVKQIALAQHSHVDIHGKLPCGVTMAWNPNNKSQWHTPSMTFGHSAIGWGVRTLPFIEQTALYDSIVAKFTAAGHTQNLITNWNTQVGPTVGTDIRSTIVSSWVCPSCPRQAVYDMDNGNLVAKGNYVGLMGPHRVGQSSRRDVCGSSETGRADWGRCNADNGDYEGLYFQGHPQFENQDGFQPGLNDITDGTSNTLMISERDGDKLKSHNADRMPGPWFGPGIPHAVGDVTFSTYYGINIDVANSGNECPSHSSAASKHPGGVNVGLADGSGRFVLETIALSVWTPLGNRQDGEVVSLP